MPGPTPDQILWDVQDEHLDEAAFEYEQWEAALDSPLYLLDELAAGPEARMLAHVDGLIAGGEAVLDRLLIPVLEDASADPSVVFVSAHVMLETASTARCGLVLDELERAADERAEALIRALELGSRTGLGAWLEHGLDGCSEVGLAGRLRALSAHGVPPDARARDWLRARDPRVVAGACRWLRGAGDPSLLGGLREALVHADAGVRRAALDTACIHSPDAIWSWVVSLDAGEDAALRERAWLWMALLGDPGVHQRMIAELGGRVPPWPVSFCGRVAAVDAAVGLLASDELGPAAGELVRAIAGLPDDDEYWEAPPPDDPDADLPAFEDDDLDAELALGPEADLRRPRADAVSSWWATRRAQLDPNLRHLDGVPLEPGSLADALRSQPCRRRHALGLEIAARSRGRVHVDTRALSARQRASAGAIPPLEAQTGLG